MERSAGRGRVGEHFLERVQNARFDRTSVAHVDVERGVAFGGEFEVLEDLFAAGERNVGDAESDAERAVVERLTHQIEDLLLLGGRRAA